MNNNIFSFSTDPFNICGEAHQFTNKIAALPIVGQISGIARILFACRIQEGHPAFPYKTAHIIRGTLEFLMLGCILLIADAALCSSKSSQNSEAPELTKPPFPPDSKAKRVKISRGKTLEQDRVRAEKLAKLEEGVFEINFSSPDDPSSKKSLDLHIFDP